MQVEKNAEDALKSFLEKVQRGFEWMDNFEMMISDSQSQEGSELEGNNEKQNNTLKIPNKIVNIIIFNKDFEVIKTKYTLDVLSSEKCSTYSKNMFSKVFQEIRESCTYSIVNKHRNGLGFYSLATELFSFRIISTKKIADASNLFDILEYQTCDENSNIKTICENFWVNFTTSFLYLIYFNVFVLMVSFYKMKDDYISGKILKNVNGSIDISKFIKMDNLVLLLEFYDYYSEANFLTPEHFAKMKDQVLEYVDTFGVIEENIWFFTEQKILSAYLEFILSTSFIHEEFNPEKGALAQENEPYIASVKVNFDKYMEEIMGYAMDRFKTYSQISSVRNSFFYHWRTLLGAVIPVRNHMLKEIFDDKLHTRLDAILKKLQGEFQKYYEVKNGRNVKELNLWKDKIKSNVVSSKNLGILAINIPCNSKNRYTQIQLIAKVEEIETELIKIQANSRNF